MCVWLRNYIKINPKFSQQWRSTFGIFCIVRLFITLAFGQSSIHWLQWQQWIQPTWRQQTHKIVSSSNCLIEKANIILYSVAALIIKVHIHNFYQKLFMVSVFSYLQTLHYNVSLSVSSITIHNILCSLYTKNKSSKQTDYYIYISLCLLPRQLIWVNKWQYTCIPILWTQFKIKKKIPAIIETKHLTFIRVLNILHVNESTHKSAVFYA